MSKLFSVVVGVALVSTSGATTPSLEGRWGVGAGVGAQRYLGSYGDEITGYGRAFLEAAPLEWVGARVSLGGGNIENAGQSHKEFHTDWFSHFGFDLLLRPQVGLGPVRPYLASGVATTFGEAVLDGVVKQDLDWNFYVPVEAGVEVILADHWSGWVAAESYLFMRQWGKLDGVRTSKSYQISRDDWDKVSLGISYRFGTSRTQTQVDSVRDADRDRIPDHQDKCPETPKGVAVDDRGCPWDGDGDGVPDYLDKCPWNPAGGQVDAMGCPVDVDKDGVVDNLDKCLGTPAGGKVGPDGCLLDTDQDGVPDYLDKCEKTTRGLPIDSHGCPIPPDTDQDGVIDKWDECPGTPGGSKVDREGCEVIEIRRNANIILRGVGFVPGTARLDEPSGLVLVRAAAAILAAPGPKIEIAVFVDEGGKESANKALTQKRAEAVLAHLVKLNVPAKRLVAKGYGSSQPLTKNTTEAGRQVNRRVELHPGM